MQFVRYMRSYTIQFSKLPHRFKNMPPMLVPGILGDYASMLAKLELRLYVWGGETLIRLSQTLSGRG